MLEKRSLCVLFNLCIPLVDDDSDDDGDDGDGGGSDGDVFALCFVFWF